MSGNHIHVTVKETPCLPARSRFGEGRAAPSNLPFPPEIRHAGVQDDDMDAVAGHIERNLIWSALVHLKRQKGMN